MTHQVSLHSYAKGRTLGIRALAAPVREEIEQTLLRQQEVVVDFSGVEVTQSYVDEIVGALILRNGPEVLGRLVFKGCSEEARKILRFVATDRSAQFLSAQSRVTSGQPFSSSRLSNDCVPA